MKVIFDVCLESCMEIKQTDQQRRAFLQSVSDLLYVLLQQFDDLPLAVHHLAVEVDHDPAGRNKH